jgi:hypothetical protein
VELVTDEYLIAHRNHSMSLHAREDPSREETIPDDGITTVPPTASSISEVVASDASMTPTAAASIEHGGRE